MGYPSTWWDTHLRDPLFLSWREKSPHEPCWVLKYSPKVPTSFMGWSEAAASIVNSESILSRLGYTAENWSPGSRMTSIGKSLSPKMANFWRLIFQPQRLVGGRRGPRHTPGVWTMSRLCRLVIRKAVGTSLESCTATYGPVKYLRVWWFLGLGPVSKFGFPPLLRFGLTRLTSWFFWGWWCWEMLRPQSTRMDWWRLCRHWQKILPCMSLGSFFFQQRSPDLKCRLASSWKYCGGLALALSRSSHVFATYGWWILTSRVDFTVSCPVWPHGYAGELIQVKCMVFGFNLSISFHFCMSCPHQVAMSVSLL